MALQLLLDNELAEGCYALSPHKSAMTVAGLRKASSNMALSKPTTQTIANWLHEGE